MSQSLTPEQALVKLRYICSRGEKCIFDVNKKLNNWGLNDDGKQDIISELIKGNYVNEQRYAIAFVRDKSRFSKWGTVKIRAALQMKGIPDTIIRVALAELQDLDYESNLEKILSAKKKSIKANHPTELKAKLIRFGISRGYEYELVYSSVLKILDNNYNP